MLGFWGFGLLHRCLDCIGRRLDRCLFFFSGDLSGELHRRFPNTPVQVTSDQPVLSGSLLSWVVAPTVSPLLSLV